MTGTTASSPPAALAAEGTHSRAFDALTLGDPEDVVGLLAYALYKKSIREAAASTRDPLPGRHRNPQRTEVEAYRHAAERILQAFADQAIADAAPELLENAVLAAISSAKTEIITGVRTEAGTVVKTVNSRTGRWGAFTLNVGAWLFSLFLTWLIVTTANIPNPLQVLRLLPIP